MALEHKRLNLNRQAQQAPTLTSLTGRSTGTSMLRIAAR